MSRNPEGELEYSQLNMGEVLEEDITTWRKAERLLQQHKEEIALSQQQSITRSRGRGR